MNGDIEQQTAYGFAKLMMNRKVRAAMRLLSDEEKGTPGLQPPTTVRDELLKKHPPCQPAHPDTLLHATTPFKTHPIIFDCLSGAAIHSAALHTNGSAGPSGIDATGWRRLCTSFQTASVDLCNSLDLVAKKVCTLHTLTPKDWHHSQPVAWVYECECICENVYECVGVCVSGMCVGVYMGMCVGDVCGHVYGHVCR